MAELWKSVSGYKDYYKISNLGRVKSISRIDSSGRFRKGRILKNTLGKNGYFCVGLSFEGKVKKFYIHKLVAIAFLNHVPCGYKRVIDHLDNNPLNNKLENLRIVSNRENTSNKNTNSSSIYTGVSWSKKKNKWLSSIRINGKSKHLGLFTDEIKASNAYREALLKTLI